MGKKDERYYTREIINQLGKRNPKIWTKIGLRSRPLKSFKVLNKGKSIVGNLKIPQLDKAKAKTADIMICTITQNIIIENKVMGAPIMTRQKRLYLNIFLDLYHKMEMLGKKSYKLIFLLNKDLQNEKYENILKELESQKIDKSEKTGLKNIKFERKPARDGWRIVKATGEYKENKKKSLYIRVKFVEVDLKNLDKIIEK